MCGSLTGGGKTTTQSALPAWASNLGQLGLTQAMGTFLNSTYNPYPGSLQAQTDPSMTIASENTGDRLNMQAPGVTAGSVTQFGTGGGPSGLAVAGSNLAAYENPYTQSVVNTTNANLTNQMDQQVQANDGQAAAAGAFGGDRAGIVNAQTQYNDNQVMAQTDAGLEQSNFTNAQQMATSDMNRELQAGTSQGQLGLAASADNTQAALQANQQNLGADQQYYNEGAGITALNQQGLNANIAQFRAEQQYPIQMQQDDIGALQGVSGLVGADASQTTTAPGASLLGSLGGLGTAATGIAGLAGLFSAGGRVGYADGGDVNAPGNDPGYVPADGAYGIDANGNPVPIPGMTARTGLAAALPAPSINLGPPSVLDAPPPYMAGNPGLEQALVPPAPPDAAPPSGTQPAPPVGLAAAAPPAEPAPDPAPSGLAAAVPPAPPGQVPYQTNVPEGPADPSLPVPPIPPEGGAPSDAGGGDDSRVQQSADPATPLPGGQGRPSGLAAAAPPAGPSSPPSGLAAAGPGNGIAGGPQMPTARQPIQVPPQAKAAAGALAKSGNSWALPVLAAGLGMLANSSPNAAKMLGGGLAGVQQLVADREATLRRQEQNQQQQIQNGLLGVKLGQLGVNQGKADTQAAVGQARVQQLQDAGQLALARAQKAAAGGSVTDAQLKDTAMKDLVSQGMSPSDAYASVSGQTIKQQQADQQGSHQAAQEADASARTDLAGKKVDQQGSQFQQQQALRQQALDATLGNRQAQAQAHATDEEDKGARSIMYSAAQSGKVVPYGAAVQQVRTTRQAVGPAPVPGAAAPAAASPAGAPAEGATIVNRATGQRMIRRGGAWQPVPAQPQVIASGAAP